MLEQMRPTFIQVKDLLLPFWISRRTIGSQEARSGNFGRSQTLNRLPHPFLESTRTLHFCWVKCCVGYSVEVETLRATATAAGEENAHSIPHSDDQVAGSKAALHVRRNNMVCSAAGAPTVIREWNVFLLVLLQSEGGEATEVVKLEEVNEQLLEENKQLHVQLVEEQQLREQYIYNCRMVGGCSVKQCLCDDHSCFNFFVVAGDAGVGVSARLPPLRAADRLRVVHRRLHCDQRPHRVFTLRPLTSPAPRLCLSEQILHWTTHLSI